MAFGLDLASLLNGPIRYLYGINGDAWAACLASLESHWDNPKLLRPHLVTLIDFTKPAKQRRLWMFNIALQVPFFYSAVAHGKNSGGPGEPATYFSNVAGTHKSCIGAFATYHKTHDSELGQVSGTGLKIHGLDTDLNGKALSRGIIFHGAKYVKVDEAGRSHGCFATKPELNELLLPMIAGGSFVYAWGGENPTVD